MNGSKQSVAGVKGAISGIIAGAAASLAMDGYWALMTNRPGNRPEQKPKPGGGQQKPEPATQVIADRIFEAATGHEIARDRKAAAGVGVHYATGMLCGAIFGAAAAGRPKLGLLAGLVYGVAIWLFIDELALRAFDVSPDAEKVPVSNHLQALGAHFVYGSVTALATRLLLRVFK